MRRSPFIILLLLVFAHTVLAQTDCPTIVQDALKVTNQVCTSNGRNQVCYGNVNLTATPRDGVSNFTFDKPGQVANVTDVQSIKLTALDTSTKAWGIAVMTLQASLPDTLPGQNVTVLMFGNVDIQNAVESIPAPITVDVTPKRKINVRGKPSTSGAVVASVDSTQAFKADGRNDQGDWLHISLDDKTRGWVSTALMTVTGDPSTLAVVTGDEPVTPSITPMQAFYFKSGVGDSPCKGAPDSGILIHSPEGVGNVNLTVNEVNVTMGSTAYFQASPGGYMTVSVIDGSVTLTAVGVTQVVPAGSVARIPLDANGRPSGPPEFPQPYDNARLDSLPLILLPEKVSIVPAATEQEIGMEASPLPSGNWDGFELPVRVKCYCSPDFQERYIIFVEDKGSVIVWSGRRYKRENDNVYRFVEVSRKVGDFVFSNETITVVPPAPTKPSISFIWERTVTDADNRTTTYQTELRPTGIPTEPLTKVEMVSFKSRTLGISGLKPVGWEQTEEGVFVQTSNVVPGTSGDTVGQMVDAPTYSRLTYRVASDGIKGYVERVIIATRGYKALPEPVQTVQGGGLTWNIYQINSDYDYPEFALADGPDGKGYVIVVTAYTEADRAFMVENILLPAIAAFKIG